MIANRGKESAVPTQNVNLTAALDRFVKAGGGERPF
jgi:hypothetical protein